MRMITSRKAIKKIAEELCLSEKTVSTYRTRLLEKMNMTTNAEISATH
jgi:two-component system invasion response regulator UvrY